MKVENLKYSAFYWGFNKQTKSKELFLLQYLSVEKNGAFVLMRGDDHGLQKQKYFTGFLDQNILQLIDSVFLEPKFLPDYSFNIDKPVIYHGLTYCFDYKIGDKKNNEILFIPPYSPKQIKLLHSVLDTAIEKSEKSSIGTLLLESYKEKLRKISLPSLPLLPLPPPPIDKNLRQFDPNKH